MSQLTTDVRRPDWISEEMFPFESNFVTTPNGHTMHYVDEGNGAPIVFIHGNPAWSFEFRHLIGGLRSKYRCIAPDHIGFGLSSRSDRREDHHPKSHAENLSALLTSLDVQDATLFMTDWGGPIGLDFARRHPDRVRRIVIANTWSWPVSRDWHFIQFSFMMRSWLGQFLVKRFNMFVNKVMPMAIGNKSVITPQMMEHYRNAQPSPQARSACAALPGHIVGASEWLNSIWQERYMFTDKPALIFWGHKDIAFRKKEMERWKSELSDFRLHEFEDCGHFLAEEAPDRILPALQEFMEE